jgi:predicted nucleic acid-binding protein
MRDDITFDTGALIALERRKSRAVKIMQNARETRSRIYVPADVVAEWWRGRTDVREDILAGLFVVPLSENIARRAGEALATVEGAGTIDAIVMATAAAVGGSVYTSDFDDLERLRAHFPSVRVLGV